MLKEPIEAHVGNAVQVLANRGQQRQQMLHQRPTSSHYGTMVPTHGMTQSTIG